MKTLAKTFFLGSTLSSFALACAFVNAAPKLDTILIESNTSDHVSMLLMPHTASEDKHQLIFAYQQQTHSQNTPLLQTKSPKLKLHKNCFTSSSKKKNELYELSTIFNDKLHVFLSYFDKQQNYKIAEKKQSSDDLSVNNNVGF